MFPIQFSYLPSLTSDQISRASAAVSSTIASTTEPIRNTAAYKALSDTLIDALDDGGSAKHGGFEEKEARRKRRQMRLAKAGKDSITGQGSRVKANAEYLYLHTLQSILSLLLNFAFAGLALRWCCTKTHHGMRSGSG